MTFANLLVEGGLIDFNIPFFNQGRHSKSMVGDELSNDPDRLVAIQDGYYFALRVQSEEDLSRFGPGHLFVTFNNGSGNPGMFAYIDTNEQAS